MRERGRNDHGVAPSCGQLLQRYRALAGLTQEGLAEKAGYSADYIGKLERDQRELPVAALDRLAAVMGLADRERAALAAARDKDRPAGLLVGRDAEITEIRRHLAGLGPPVLLFAAEPGMGKTRLLEEAAERAARSGWGIARGTCQRRALDPYAPLTSALTDALDRMPDRDRTEALQQAGQLDLLLPELTEANARPPGQLEQQRRLLFSSAGHCLRAAAGQAGTLLILDDLHWAGPDALDLLTTLLTAPEKQPIRLIGAYRDSETPACLDEFIADLARALRIKVLSLGPLSDADAEQLLIHLAGKPERQDMPKILPAIVRRAGGVPFFLVSYVEDVRHGSEGLPPSTMPWTVAKVIRQRILALPSAVQEHLDVAAVIGRTVPHRLLAQVAGSSDEEVLHATEAALNARLLTEDGTTYSFTHDLIRETIEHNLSAARRRLLHRRIGETLERDPGPSAESLAFHFALSDDDGKAITYLELAGEQAQRRVAFAAAADFFAQAAERLELAGRQADAVPVIEKQGVALHRAGRHGEAIGVLERALARHQAAADEDGVHRVIGHLADAHFRRGTSDDVLVQDIGLAQDLGSPAAITRWQGLFRLLFAQGSYQQLVTVGRSLAQAGRTAGNSRLEALGAGVHGTGLIRQGQLAEGTTLLAQAMPSAGASADIGRIADAATMLSGAYLAMGALERCETLSARMLRAAESVGDQVVAAMHTLVLGAVCYVRGDWSHGQDLIRQVQQRFTAGDPSPLAIRVSPGLATILIWQGAWEQARSYLDNSAEAARSMGVADVERAVLAHLAELDVLEGHPQDAVTRLQPHITSDLTWDCAVTFWSALARAHLTLEDPHPAAAHAEQAVAEARRSGAWLYGIRALEVQGMAHARHGDHNRAQAAYLEGLQRARAMPFPYGEAHLLHAQGLLDRREGDETAAHAKFSAALAIFEALGAERDATRLCEMM
jgi:transcriptional regulator with XRE-family HTH domain/tetratricopeptide (TPR) repeat protein